MKKGLTFLNRMHSGSWAQILYPKLEGERDFPLKPTPTSNWLLVTKYRTLLQSRKEGAQGDEATPDWQFGRLLPQGQLSSWLWNLKTSKPNNCFSQQESKVCESAVEDKGCRTQLQKPTANHFLLPLFPTKSKLPGTSPPDRLPALRKSNGKRSYLFGKQRTGMAPYFSFSVSINPSIYLPFPPSNSLVVKPKPLTTPILLNSDHITLHYLLLPRTSPS